MLLRREDGKRPPWAAGVFDEGVFQVQVEHFNAPWFERLDDLPLLVVVTHQHQFQLRAYLNATDQPGNRRLFGRMASDQVGGANLAGG